MPPIRIVQWASWAEVFKSLDKLRVDANERGRPDPRTKIAEQREWKELAHCYAWNMCRMKMRIDAEQAIRRGLG